MIPVRMMHSDYEDPAAAGAAAASPAVGGAPVVVEIRPGAPWQAALAAAFRALQGRRVRITLAGEESLRQYTGRVMRVREWPHPLAPVLRVAPGALDGVHVLAEADLTLREQDGVLFLGRRRWYEVDELDCVRLGSGPLQMEICRLE